MYLPIFIRAKQRGGSSRPRVRVVGWLAFEGLDQRLILHDWRAGKAREMMVYSRFLLKRGPICHAREIIRIGFAWTMMTRRSTS